MCILHGFPESGRQPYCNVNGTSAIRVPGSLQAGGIATKDIYVKRKIPFCCTISNKQSMTCTKFEAILEKSSLKTVLIYTDIVLLIMLLSY